MHQNSFLNLIKELFLSLIFLATLVSAIYSVNVSANQVVRYSTVSQQELQSHKLVTGTLKAFSQSDIAAAEAGLVMKVFVNEGDTVVKGQTLIQLDHRKISAEVSRIEAELALAQAQHELAQAEFNLAEDDFIAYKESATKNAISEQRLRQSKTTALTSQARVIAAFEAVKSLKAQLTFIRVRLSDMSIKAPFDGQITQRSAEPGQWLGVGDSAMVLISQGKLEAWLDVPERFANKLMTSPDLIGLNIGEQMLNGTDNKVLKAVDSRARTFKLVSQVTSTNLMPGMSVKAWLPEGKKTAQLTVPKDAIIRRGNNTLVYKVSENGDKQNASPVPVNILFHQGNIAAINSNMLVAGDKVITEGNERLMPGPVVAIPDEKGSAVTASTQKVLK